jgi:hypothetical protein
MLGSLGTRASALSLGFCPASGQAASGRNAVKAIFKRVTLYLVRCVVEGRPLGAIFVVIETKSRMADFPGKKRQHGDYSELPGQRKTGMLNSRAPLCVVEKHEHNARHSHQHSQPVKP